MHRDVRIEHRALSALGPRARGDRRSLRALSALFGDGLVVGDRYYDADGGKGRTANKFFTKALVPLY